MSKLVGEVISYHKPIKIRKVVKGKIVAWGISIPQDFIRYLRKEVKDFENRRFQLDLVHYKEDDRLEIIIHEIKEWDYGYV